MTDQKRSPMAFMSYVRFDDDYEDGKLTKFRERLSSEVRLQSGQDFPIFQDHADIKAGQDWKQRIDESLDGAKFLIAVITPSFFNSDFCRYELQRFFEREQRLGRNDLIFPVYYVNCRFLHDETRLAQDELAKKLMTRQFTDWRELRHEPFTSPQVSRMLEKLAIQIRDAMERDPSPNVATKQEPLSERTGGGEKAARVDERASTTSEEVKSETATAKSVSPPAIQTSIPTFVVDQLHRGDYTTITEAVEAARPGARIIVRPGLYEEGLVIDKPLEIIGDGEVGEVVIRAVGKDAVLFETNMGRISNLTLRQEGGGKWYGVDITQGRLELEGCDISSKSLACVAIHGGADPRLRRNRIHDGKQSGVFVYENGQGLLEDNDIFGNAISGVTIRTGGNPTLRGNRIHNGKQTGVHIQENGQGLLEDNDIFGNAFSGVEIKTGGSPTLRGNRIHDGKGGGVFVYENGQGLLEDNDIFGNARASVAIKTDGSPTLRRNRIHDGKQSGVYVYENGQGLLEDNDIIGNAHYGVLIKTGGSPTVRKNRINRNACQAVCIQEKGHGVIEDNDLRDNEKGPWLISEDSTANVKKSRNVE